MRFVRTVALASAYNRLHRHEGRKRVPDQRHLKADVAAAQETRQIDKDAFFVRAAHYTCAYYLRR